MLSTLKSLLTKCVNKSETGVYSSFSSLGEGLLPLLVSPLYTYVFHRTIETMPGAFYFISFSMAILIAIIASIASLYYIELTEEDGKQKDEKKSQ